MVMLRFLTVLVVALASGTTVMAGVLESHTSPLNGHAYYLLQVATWTASEAEAVALGGHLASIESQSEQDWIWQTFGAGKERHLWIGLTDVALEGAFVWSSGAPLAYTNWTPGEPSNEWGIEHWVHLDGFRNGEWNDMDERIPGSVALPVFGVVEVVPEPAGWQLLAAGAAVAACSWRRVGRQASRAA
jgi:hypothetical protein